MERRDEQILQRIIQYCDRAAEYRNHVLCDRERFLENPMVQDACCMCIVQIGELSSRLSDELRQAHPEIPWRVIKDTRNFYVHNYGRVDLNYVWDALIEDLPSLRQWCDSYLSGGF